MLHGMVMELQLFSYQHNIIIIEDAKLEISSLHINKKLLGLNGDE